MELFGGIVLLLIGGSTLALTIGVKKARKWYIYVAMTLVFVWGVSILSTYSPGEVCNSVGNICTHVPVGGFIPHK